MKEDNFQRFISHCCEAGVRKDQTDEGTFTFICNDCHNDCDVIIKNPQKIDREGDFVLSEKRQDNMKPKRVYNVRYTYAEDDVKEFIRRLKDDLVPAVLQNERDIDILKTIDKLAGDLK